MKFATAAIALITSLILGVKFIQYNAVVNTNWKFAAMSLGIQVVLIILAINHFYSDDKRN